jgi:hypothetical protein
MDGLVVEFNGGIISASRNAVVVHGNPDISPKNIFKFCEVLIRAKKACEILNQYNPNEEEFKEHWKDYQYQRIENLAKMIEVGDGQE